MKEMKSKLHPKLWCTGYFVDKKKVFQLNEY